VTPATVVQAGYYTSDFAFATPKVKSAQTVTVTATYGGKSAQATVTVTP